MKKAYRRRRRRHHYHHHHPFITHEVAHVQLQNIREKNAFETKIVQNKRKKNTLKTLRQCTPK